MLTPRLSRAMKTGVFALSSGVVSTFMVMSPSAQLVSVDAVDVAPRAFDYRLAGDFSQKGRPVDAPLAAIDRASVLHIMKHQVTVTEYDHCVADSRCVPRPPPESSDPNLPAVQVSWEDATAYASWLSAETGDTWRLPTDEEWVFAAGSLSMTMLYWSPPRAILPCAGSPVMKRNQNGRRWISGRALLEPSAQMNTDCSIYRGTSGNGPTVVLSGNPSTRWASLLALRQLRRSSRRRRTS